MLPSAGTADQALQRRFEQHFRGRDAERLSSKVCVREASVQACEAKSGPINDLASVRPKG